MSNVTFSWLRKTFPLVQRIISSRFLLITLKIVVMLCAADTFVLLNAIRALPVQSVPYLKQTDDVFCPKF